MEGVLCISVVIIFVVVLRRAYVYPSWVHLNNTNLRHPYRAVRPANIQKTGCPTCCFSNYFCFQEDFLFFCPSCLIEIAKYKMYKWVKRAALCPKHIAYWHNNTSNKAMFWLSNPVWTFRFTLTFRLSTTFSAITNIIHQIKVVYLQGISKSQELVYDKYQMCMWVKSLGFTALLQNSCFPSNHFHPSKWLFWPQ